MYCIDIFTARLLSPLHHMECLCHYSVVVQPWQDFVFNVSYFYDTAMPFSFFSWPAGTNKSVIPYLKREREGEREILQQLK